MRTARLVSPRSVVVDEAEVPEPGPGQVRVRLDGCGVCPSSLPLYEGRPWFDYPREPGQPGHEGWGILDAVGAGVHGRRAGEREIGRAHV